MNDTIANGTFTLDAMSVQFKNEKIKVIRFKKKIVITDKIAKHEIY